eukprot:1308633-Rhodomonas_salina.1
MMFLKRMLITFFFPTHPASSIEKPACMKKTIAPALIGRFVSGIALLEIGNGARKLQRFQFGVEVKSCDETDEKKRQ